MLCVPFQVRVSIFESQNEVLSIVFNATNSHNTNWFSASRVISSPWTDFVTNPPAFFSLNVPSDRSFYISTPLIACGNDGGWLVVSSGPCAWDKRFPAPSILYSKLKTSTNWNVHGKRKRRAILTLIPVPVTRTLDNSNFFLFPLKVGIMGSRLYKKSSV